MTFFDSQINPVTKIHRNLEIGGPNDKYEKQADAVANRVVAMPNTAGTIQMQSHLSSPDISMMCAECEKEKGIQMLPNEEEEIRMKPVEEEKIQMKPSLQRSANGTMHASAEFANKLQSQNSQGRPLPGSVNNEMGNKIGLDFSNVKIHTNSQAVQMSQEIGAQAFTNGDHIYFNKGKYDPGSARGKHLLAHELTHVIQQSGEIQRSCSDGNCDSCAGGTKDFWVTFYFRVRATRSVMGTLRTMISEAKTILANCCLNLKADFNWDLLGGNQDVDPFTMNADGTWNYNPSVTDVGESTAFSSARGVPILVVDNVQNTGGGITVGSSFDAAYTGVEYFVLAVNQINSNANCNHLAHELWHVGSDRSRHNAATDGTLAACTGNDVSANYCSGLRGMV